LVDARRRPHRFTLTHAFLLSTGGTAVVVALLLFGFVAASKRSILDAADLLRKAAARRVEQLVAQDLGSAERTIAHFEQQVRLAAVDVDDPVSIERALFVALIEEDPLSDVTFTRAEEVGYDPAGDALLAPAHRWELSVYRASATDPSSGITSRRITASDGGWKVERRDRAPGEPYPTGAFTAAGAAGDPTMPSTFTAAAARDSEGHALWSDLHWSEIDPGDPDRVVMTVQKAVRDRSGRFAGVLRVGLLTRVIDRATRVRVAADDDAEAHRIFLCDPGGRLVTRLDPTDRLQLSGDDLRFVASREPPEVAAALAQPLLGRMTAGTEASGSFVTGGRRYLFTFRGLQSSQDWIVGVVVPEEVYTHRLEAVRNRFLVLYLLAMVFVLVGGALMMRAVRRGLGQVGVATARMRSFDFAPAPSGAPFRDVEAVLESLERAKTAMRTLGKYAPVDLVRELYRANREPKLGGELAELTILFTDIRGFTGLAERLGPNELAEALGRYLDAMTAAIRSTGGTLDKFIGDAVMALWNAPTPVERHAERGCQAILACKQATADLYRSAAWGGLPALVTRFGLHTDRVLVGHFGAPERMSFTAMGDGVNLASRLEALGKQYGVTALVSESVVARAGEGFSFRRIDKVAVKGKTHAVVVYELLGESGPPRPSFVDAYEAALDDYGLRRFEAAMARLAPRIEEDPPSRVLFDRCRILAEHPPPDGWDGVFVATSK
jgi:adenylate cyclase